MEQYQTQEQPSTSDRDKKKENDAQSTTSSVGSISQAEDSTRGTVSDKCNGNCTGISSLAPSGKKKQMIKILTLILLPIFALITLAISDLINTVRRSIDATETRRNVRLSQQVGSLIHSLQRERDMTALYISSLLEENGPERKTFLIDTYPMTDEVLQSLDDWPVKGTKAYKEFKNKQECMNFLFKYRLMLDNQNTTIYEVIHFYTDAIQIFIDWFNESVGKSGGQGVWETLVAYQLLIIGMEQIGIERTLGAVFFTQGGFHQTDYLWYMKTFQVGESNIWASQKYSSLVSSILDERVSLIKYDFQTTISNMRKEISQNDIHRLPSWQDGTWWFDNMTIYIDTLHEIQSKMAVIILSRLDEAVKTDNTSLSTGISIMVVVIIIGIVIFKAVESLTSSMKEYGLILADQTKVLNSEKKRTDTLLYQMLPKIVAERLKCNKNVKAEEYSSATIMFSNIVEFTRVCSESTPLQIVDMLNHVYTVFDNYIDKYDVYKVETIGDAHVVVSGIPKRNGNTHGSEIALLAFNLLNSIKSVVIPQMPGYSLTIRIGIHTGPVVSGIVGSKMPRYCLFGETVNMASHMESSGVPNRIQVSETTHKVLSNIGGYSMDKRGKVLIKGHGFVVTYWLLQKETQLSVSQRFDVPPKGFDFLLPGECSP
ncbi:uncharacterized protein LOC117100038 isoform X2 [Anneissia japonica]|uniref:uncharacterized protein LOC117100038 isoform X2 n=1 Tax=Anneissia japonica TaxID=1529436 RepID=UPI0014259E39|nr:uncharacterized protein LOC117100038 isoform X2 [Anneissia japonica]